MTARARLYPALIGLALLLGCGSSQPPITRLAIETVHSYPDYLFHGSFQADQPGDYDIALITNGGALCQRLEKHPVIDQDVSLLLNCDGNAALPIDRLIESELVKTNARIAQKWDEYRALDTKCSLLFFNLRAEPSAAAKCYDKLAVLGAEIRAMRAEPPDPARYVTVRVNQSRSTR